MFSGVVTVKDVSPDGKVTYAVLDTATYIIKLPCGCYIRWAVDADKYRYCPVCGKRISDA